MGFPSFPSRNPGSSSPSSSSQENPVLVESSVQTQTRAWSSLSLTALTPMLFVFVSLFSSVWCHCSGWRDACVTVHMWCWWHMWSSAPPGDTAPRPGGFPVHGVWVCRREVVAGIVYLGAGWGFAACGGSRCGSAGICDEWPLCHTGASQMGRLQVWFTVMLRTAVWSCVKSLCEEQEGAVVTEGLGLAAPSVPLWFWVPMKEGVWKHLNKECLWKWPLVILAHASTKAAIVFLLVKQQSSSRWGFFLFPCSIMLAFMCPPGPHPAVWWASTQMHCSGSHIPGRSNAPAPHQLHICNC